MATPTSTTAPGARAPGTPVPAPPSGGTPAPAPRGPAAAPRTTRAVPVAIALLAASLPMFMATLDNLVVTSALPVLQAELGASLTDLQWVVNAYTLAFATLMIAAATLGDRWGRRRTFLGGIAVFTLGSVAAALAGSPGTLVAARALQGVGAAAVMPLSLALLAAAVPASRRAMAIGVWGGVSGLGVALGPVVGGAVVEGISWQAMFWINVPVALVAVPLVLRALPEQRGRAQRLDVLGLLLAAAGVLGVVWGVVHGTTTAGPPRACSPRWSAASWRSARSSGTRPARRTLWCRCGCSGHGASPWPTPPASRSRSARSARSSCSRSTCRSPRGTPRWRPACARCPGPPRRWSSRRSPGRWRRASASGCC